MTPRPHGHGCPRRSNGWRGAPGYTCTSRFPMPRGSISWRSSSVPSLGLPSQVRGHTDACIAAYNATAHPFEWTTQVVCAKHFQVSTYANECHQVLVYCLSNGFTTPGLRQNVFNWLVHTNDLWFSLQSRMNSSIASTNSGRLLKTPHGIRLRGISRPGSATRHSPG